MKKQIATIALLLTTLGLISQSKTNIDNYQPLSQSHLDEVLSGDEYQLIGKMENSAGQYISESHNSMNEIILDSTLYFRYYSISDSIKEVKKEYEWYPWGDYKTDYKFDWDEFNSHWVNSEKNEYIYDTNSVFYGYDSYIWDTGLNDWVNKAHWINTYDNYGYRDSIITLTWNEELHRWDNSHFLDYNYDENGNELSFIWWSGNENNQWVPSSKRESDYNPDGTLNFEIFTNWDESIEDWIFGSMKEYYYNDIGLLDSMYYFSWASKALSLNYQPQYSTQVNQHTTNITLDNSSRNEWELLSKYEYEYDENNNQILRIHCWFDNDQWANGHKTEYYYDEHNTEVMQLKSSWNSDNNTWVFNNKSESAYIYDFSEEGTPTMFSHYNWDLDYEIWVGSSKTTFIYDENGRSLIYKYYSWDVSDWEIDKKRFYYRSEFIGLPEFENIDFQIYPNPVGNMLNIKNLSNKNVNCSIISATGQKLMHFKVDGRDAQINIKEIPSGVYFLLINKGSETAVKKFIKN